MLGRPDWEAMRHTPFAQIPCGSGNALAASVGMWSVDTAVHAVVKSQLHAMDMATGPLLLCLLLVTSRCCAMSGVCCERCGQGPAACHRSAAALHLQNVSFKDIQLALDGPAGYPLPPSGYSQPCCTLFQSSPPAAPLQSLLWLLTPHNASPSLPGAPALLQCCSTRRPPAASASSLSTSV